jgi:hypothetical protein
MSITKLNNIFSFAEIELIHDAISLHTIDIDSNLGRGWIGDIKNQLAQEVKNKIYRIISDISSAPLAMDHILYAEYSAKYGQPNLPPHFDGDTNDLIINMQLKSNTSWDIGLNLETYTLEDNSAVVFNGNTEAHWRPLKEFKEGEYVKMLFMRFYNLEKRSDYSHLSQYWPDNEIFKEIRALRNSLV